MEDPIKNAFQKVKQDMDSMKEEIDSLNLDLKVAQEQLKETTKLLQTLSSQLIKSPQIEEFKPTDNPTQNPQNPTIPTDNPTHNMALKPLKPLNLGISTGNEGVPTNKPTNQQTNQHIKKASFDEAMEVLSSLDSLKKDIRNKFKRITEQEFLVFSTIYQMEEEDVVDYKSLSKKLNLSEASIRDYVGKLIKKGIPVEKTRINNKMIQLSISENLKKIASLPVILQLREL